MKFNGINEKLQSELVQKLNDAEDKGQAIYEVVQTLNEETHKQLIEELVADAEAIQSGRSTAAALGIRTTFDAEEKSFYNNIKQAVTFDADAVIPTSIIDRTLQDVREASDVLSLVNMAPAGVGKWITGSHSGTGAWGKLTDKLTAELTSKLSSMDVDANKAYVLLVVPKAVRDLGMGIVDKYFSAILAEAMHDVLVKGYLEGNGVGQPVGLSYKLPNEEGTVSAKDVLTTVTGFAPADLAAIKTTLSNGGKRKVNKIHVIANPATVYTYIDPALYLLTVGGVYAPVSKDEIIVHEEPAMTADKAIFTVENAYTMGMSAVTVDEYRETKALDDADLFVGKCYANGRADDDNAAVVINATKLKKASLPVITAPSA